ncbi:MAG TPA: hypothetical protein VNO52_15830 [Methylomirabilota bacterium]|nr:hypothetical protein [Methylomirabilota bacterium]
MFTLLCSLTFPDGQVVTGKLHALSANEDYPVTYDGAVARLPERVDVTDEGGLRIFFKTLARETGAQYHETSTGEYERWAQ